MKTFFVKKTFRDENTYHPIKTKIIGIVTAYTYLSAMRKAACKYNNGSWSDLSVVVKTSQNEKFYFKN